MESNIWYSVIFIVVCLGLVLMAAYSIRRQEIKNAEKMDKQADEAYKNSIDRENFYIQNGIDIYEQN